MDLKRFEGGLNGIEGITRGFCLILVDISGSLEDFERF